MPTVRLNWTDPNSGVLQEDEIRVYRAEAPFDIGSLPSVLATLAADTVTYDDTTIVSGVSYWYAVVMVRGAELRGAFTGEVTDFVPVSGTNWRIRVDETAYSEFGAAANTTIQEVEMRLTAGGADECTGGTSTGSSTGTNTDRAFDNDSGTIWNPGGSFPFYIGYNFSSAKEIIELHLTGRSDTFIGDGPTVFTLETNDGSVVEVADFITGPWGPGESRVFNISDNPDPSRRFIRLRPTGAHGGNSISRFSCAAVEFRTSPGGSNIATGGTAMARDYEGANLPANAFDGDLGTRYASRTQDQFPYNYIGYFLTSDIADDVVQVALTCTNAAFGPGEAPTGFHVEWGAGNVWTLLWTETSIPAWTAGETKVFTKP